MQPAEVPPHRWPTRSALLGCRVSLNPPVSSLDERDTPASVLHIRVEVLRDRGSLEVIERHAELHGRIIVRDEVLQQEEIHVAPEALEQCEESRYRFSVSPKQLGSSRPR
jgi:hypothetical protein